ncbi:MAG: PD40 domain-containing protein [Ardenticatenaceae bacterium]|nr:PD40 domain-containing protein [Anaerolineales bacterium]MCB8978522.1 PD40 domain-containing protein [Ardenticatenaceae bacterium]
MTPRKVLALFVLLTLWLLATACTAEAEPVMEATAVPPIVTEPTAAPTDMPLPTPTIEPTVESVPMATELPANDLDSFMAEVQSALANRDFDQLASLMSDPVAFGGYRSEWQQFAPADLRPLLENLLPVGAVVQFSPANTDLSAMLDGQDPQTMLGPDISVVAAWHSTGWGAEGEDEAILFMAEERDGRFALKAMLYAPYGFLLELNDLPVRDEQPAPVGLLYSQPDGSLWQVGTDGEPVQLWYQEGITAVPSPDGKHAFFQVQGDLWLLDITSGETRALTTDHDEQGTHLAGFHWWYNNDTILSGIWLDFESDGGPNTGRPALIDIASGEVTLVDSQHLMSSNPAISASGAIAYSSVQQSANDRQTAWIYRPESGVMAFEAAEFANAVANAGYTSPAWSADGRFLAWLAFTGNNETHTAVFDLESGSVANLPPSQAVGFGGPYPSPIIGPDPNWIALRQFTPNPDQMGLWLYTQDGQQPVFIAQNGGESLWLNDHVLLFIDYDENYNADLQQYDTLTGIRSAVMLPDVFKIFGIVE